MSRVVGNTLAAATLTLAAAFSCTPETPERPTGTTEPPAATAEATQFCGRLTTMKVLDQPSEGRFLIENEGGCVAVYLGTESPAAGRLEHKMRALVRCAIGPNPPGFELQYTDHNKKSVTGDAFLEPGSDAYKLFVANGLPGLKDCPTPTAPAGN